MESIGSRNVPTDDNVNVIESRDGSVTFTVFRDVNGLGTGPRDRNGTVTLPTQRIDIGNVPRDLTVNGTVLRVSTVTVACPETQRNR